MQNRKYSPPSSLNLEHFLTSVSAEAVQTPWVLHQQKILKKLAVTGCTVAEAETRCGIKFGYATENHQIIKTADQRHGRNFINIRCKFNVSLIDHQERASLPAAVQNGLDLRHFESGRSRIVRVT